MRLRPFTPVIIVGCFTAFIFDITVSFGSAFGVLYVPLLFLRLTMHRPPHVAMLLLVVCLMTAAGFFLPTMSDNVAEALFDRLMTLLAAIFTAVLIEQKIIANRSLNISRVNEARLKLKGRLIDNEIKIAKGLQESILPKLFPQSSKISGHGIMVPAREVGGDFFDFIQIDEDHIGISIGDVTGKGVPAAFFMAIVRTLLRSIALLKLTPSECLFRINNQIASENEQGMFVTIFYGIVDLRSGELIYANGGHNSPALVKNDGQFIWLDETGGSLIGMFPDLNYRENIVRLNPGDSLFLYTDGVVEAFDQSKVQFSESRLEAVLRMARGASVEQLTQSVLDAVKSFENGSPQTDDITCVCVRYGGG